MKDIAELAQLLKLLKESGVTCFEGFGVKLMLHAAAATAPREGGAVKPAGPEEELDRRLFRRPGFGRSKVTDGDAA